MYMKMSAGLVSVFVILVMQLTVSFAGGITADGYIESTDSGFIFPDGSIQTTAAIDAEVVGYPQQCKTTVSASEEVYLTCYTFGPTNITWSGVNGVPAGYYFLVTDISIFPFTTLDAGEYTFSFYQIGGCATGSVGGGSLTRLFPFRIVPNTQTLTAHYQSPLTVLSPGQCLRVSGYSSNTSDAQFSVTGYLTNDPDRFRY